MSGRRSGPVVQTVSQLANLLSTSVELGDSSTRQSSSATLGCVFESIDVGLIQIFESVVIGFQEQLGSPPAVEIF